MSDPAQQLATAITALDDRPLLVVTGAGVSRASGIPTFRGNEPEAVWRQSDVELASREYFHRDPAGQWRWYLERFAKVEAARPNPAHRALAALETWHEERERGFLLVTQNIDTLHEEAGSRRLVKVHGTSDRLRCSRRGCENGAPTGSLARATVDLEPFRAEPVADNLPRCPACDALLRAHVLFFDEYYEDHQDYRFAEVAGAAERAGLVLFVGTSLAVGITDLIVRAARRAAAPIFALDPRAGELPASAPWLQALVGRAEEVLPALNERLEAA